MNIWDFNRLISQRLFNYNMVNFSIGQTLYGRGEFLKGVGTQAMGWSVINIGIALVGGSITRNRFETIDDPMQPGLLKKETRNLRLLLTVNTLLDLGYMWGGYKFAHSAKEDAHFRRGNGWGIVLQGAFLFFFDLYHLLKMSKIRNTADSDS